ncbi:transposase [Mesorhizobium sp. M0598]|uniref:transposase n=1 Tax=Mesorhizobium sp. M0598 TaxID=2956968 RepID=UPI0033357A35
MRAPKARAEASRSCGQGSSSGARMRRPPKSQRKRQGGVISDAATPDTAVDDRHCGRLRHAADIDPADAMTAEEVLQTYRLRWQVELAFKRLKSGMGIHKLPARDERLARSWLMAHLILALIIDEAVNDVLDSPPCEDETTHGAIAVPLEAA